MKFILVPILMILILTQTFSKWLVVLEYSINKDFITEKLCVNKARPQLKCKGKCQMMKRLAEEEKQNSSNTTNSTSKINIQETLFTTETYEPSIQLLTTFTTVHNEEPPVWIHQGPSYPIFHPPAQA